MYYLPMSEKNFKKGIDMNEAIEKLGIECDNFTIQFDWYNMALNDYNKSKFERELYKYCTNSFINLVSSILSLRIDESIPTINYLFHNWDTEITYKILDSIVKKVTKEQIISSIKNLKDWINNPSPVEQISNIEKEKNVKAAKDLLLIWENELKIYDKKINFFNFIESNDIMFYDNSSESKREIISFFNGSIFIITDDNEYPFNVIVNNIFLFTINYYEYKELKNKKLKKYLFNGF